MLILIFYIFREPFIILSGGLSYDTVGRRPCLTVMHGKSTAVLEMDYSIVDFLTLCETPYPSGRSEIYFSTLLILDLATIFLNFCLLVVNYRFRSTPSSTVQLFQYFKHLEKAMDIVSPSLCFCFSLYPISVLVITNSNSYFNET